MTIYSGNRSLSRRLVAIARVWRWCTAGFQERCKWVGQPPPTYQIPRAGFPVGVQKKRPDQWTWKRLPSPTSNDPVPTTLQLNSHSDGHDCIDVSLRCCGRFWLTFRSRLCASGLYPISPSYNSRLLDFVPRRGDFSRWCRRCSQEATASVPQSL